MNVSYKDYLGSVWGEGGGVEYIYFGTQQEIPTRTNVAQNRTIKRHVTEPNTFVLGVGQSLIT